MSGLGSGHKEAGPIRRVARIRGLGTRVGVLRTGGERLRVRGRFVGGLRRLVKNNH